MQWRDPDDPKLPRIPDELTGYYLKANPHPSPSPSPSPNPNPNPIPIPKPNPIPNPNPNLKAWNLGECRPHDTPMVCSGLRKKNLNANPNPNPNPNHNHNQS